MTGQPLDAFACPVCARALAEDGTQAVRCAGSPPHSFVVRDGAPILFPEGPERSAALAAMGEAYAKWAESRGGRWDRERRRVWRTVIREAIAAAPPPGVFADIGAGGGGLAAMAAHARYRAIAIDATLPPEGPYLRAAADFESVPLAPASVRVAALVASLHYADDITRVLRRVREVLHPDGLLVIALTPVHGTADGAKGAAATTQGEIREAAGDAPLASAYRHLTRAELAGALQAAGFASEERGSGLSPWYSAARTLKERASGDEFASFPLLLCRPHAAGGSAP